MAEKSKSRVVIINCIAWAVMILAISLLLRKEGVGPDVKTMIVMVNIMGWFIVHSALPKNKQSFKEELACLGNKFRRK